MGIVAEGEGLMVAGEYTEKMDNACPFFKRVSDVDRGYL